MRLLRGARSTVALVRRALRAELASSALLFVLVLATAAVAASVPKLVDRAGADGLRHALDQANAVERSLAFARQTHKLVDVETSDDGVVVPAAGDPLAAVERAGDELAAELPETIASAVVDEQYVVDTAQYIGVGAPKSLTYLRLRYQSGIEDHIRYVEGRPPTSAVEIPDCPSGQICHPSGANPSATFEVALSQTMADTLLLEVGDRVGMQLESGTPLPLPGAPPALPSDSRYIGVLVTGIFEVLDPADDFWLRDTLLEQPTIEPISLDLANYYGAALVNRETYGMLPGLIDYTYAWRFRLDPTLVDASALPLFERELRRLQAQYPVRPPAATAQTPSLRTGLSQVLADYGDQRAATEAALAFIAAGPLTAVGGSLVLIALLWMGRRQPALLYLRQRGATSIQVLGRTLGEALLVVLPGAALGLLLAELLVPGSLPAAVLAATATAGLAVSAVLVAALPTARASLGATTHDDAGAPASRRLVLDVLVVGLAVVGAVSLAERGPLSEAGGVEPFLAIVPALVGIAAGIVLLRVYPLPIRLLARLARRARGLVAPHALRVSGREGGLTRMPLLVLLLAAALAVFTSAILVTLDRGQFASSWQQMGADYRIEAHFGDVIPTELSVEQAPGVSVATPALLTDGVLSGDRTRSEGVPLLAVESAGYEALLAGTPTEVRLPASFDGPFPARVPGDPVGSAIGNEENPLPAVISTELADTVGASTGDLLDLTIRGGRTIVRVDQVRATLPRFDPGTQVMVLPREALRAAYPEQGLLPTELLVRAEPAGERELRALVEPFTRRVSMSSRHEVHAELHDAPLAAAIGGGLQLALLVTLGYGAVALAASTLLSLLARRREIVLLRTLGVRSRQLAELLLLGQLPGVVAALAVGLALGLGLAALLLPSLGLEAFTGPAVTVRLQLEPIHLALAVILPAVLALGLTLGGAWAIGRGNLAAIIRAGDSSD